jgi:nephrocystin-3
MPTQNRRIRVFVSSTFRDMMGERDDLMIHTWPELRRFCRERQVELVEVDRANAECLDEIRACRPYFIGLLASAGLHWFGQVLKFIRNEHAG